MKAAKASFKLFWFFVFVAGAFFSAFLGALANDGGDIPVEGPRLRF